MLNYRLHSQKGSELVFGHGFDSRQVHQVSTHPTPRGDDMNQKEKEQVERQKNLNQFNNVTQKVKPENQNQTYNVRKEGINPINQKR